ncbi:MAG: VanZ family protein [Pirellulales bacterium]|nr:VanZ family protein [Pirellulales bacterium]
MNEATKRRIRTCRFALSVYWLTMFIGSHMPVEQQLDVSHGDKLIHFAAFAVLAYFIAFYRSLFGPMTRNAYIMIFIIVAVYGAFDEATQMLVAGREGDPLDWLADIVGGAAGLGVFWLLNKKSQQAKLSVHQND